MNKEVEFGKYIGMELQKQEDGEAEVALKVLPHHLNSQNIVHGGVFLAMMDLAMGAAASSYGTSVVTMDLQYRFFRPAKVGETVVAQGKVLKNVTEGKMLCGDECIGAASGQFFKGR